jgi:hypothetical protein
MHHNPSGGQTIRIILGVDLIIIAQYSCARMLELAVVVGLARVMPRFQNCSKSHDRDVVVYFNYSEQRV